MTTHTLATAFPHKKTMREIQMDYCKDIISENLSLFDGATNDAHTRDNIKYSVENEMQDLICNNFIHDYHCICDETNNVPNSTSVNVSVYLKVHRSVDFVCLTCTLD